MGGNGEGSLQGDGALVTLVTEPGTYFRRLFRYIFVRKFSFFLSAAFLCWLPLAQANPCALSSAKRESIRQLAQKSSSTLYGNSAFIYPPKPGQDWSQTLNFDLETKAGDLIDQEGKIFLFRSISGAYQEKYDDHGKTYVRREGNAYSYSLSPNIINAWSNTASPNSYTLVSQQNLFSDELKYPADGGPTVLIRPLLLPSTKVSDIIYYNEVKVPVARENVLLAIRQKKFKEIVDSFGKRKYRLRELFEKLLASPEIEEPNCQVRREKAVLFPADAGAPHDEEVSPTPSAE